MNKALGSVITWQDIKAVLRAAVSRTPDDNLQLSILSRALICAAKTIGVPRRVVVRELERAWDETEKLT